MIILTPKKFEKIHWVVFPETNCLNFNEFSCSYYFINKNLGGSTLMN